MRQDNIRKREYDPRNIRYREIGKNHYKEHYEDRNLKKTSEIEEKSKSGQKEPSDLSVEESLPFERMFKDGILRVERGKYSKTLTFEDTNYTLMSDDQKTAILKLWGGFLNTLDDDTTCELTLLKHPTDPSSMKKVLTYEAKDDEDQELAEEYSKIIRKNYLRSNQGYTLKRYLTVTVKAESREAAARRFEIIEESMQYSFDKLGAKIKALNGQERMKLLHKCFHLRSNPCKSGIDGLRREMEKAAGLDDHLEGFDTVPRMRTGENANKSVISPERLDFPKPSSMLINDTAASVSAVDIDAAELTDDFLLNIVEPAAPMILSVHIKPQNKVKAVKSVKQSITEIERSKIDSQKHAFRQGFDTDIVSVNIDHYDHQAKELLDGLLNKDERLYLVTMLVMQTGKDEQELKDNIKLLEGRLQPLGCRLMRLSFQQENALQGVLPVGKDAICTDRQLKTSGVAILLPFNTKELFQKRREALYYGTNALTGYPIMLDRKALKTPSGVILGTPGGGKSFAAKREILNVLLRTDDAVIIADPEAEYSSLVRRRHGQVIELSAMSRDFINPLDISMEYTTASDALQMKINFLFSFFEIILGRKDGLRYSEVTIIDRCMRKVYEPYFFYPDEETMPTLENFYQALLRQEDPAAKEIAMALEIYVHGSMSVFNHKTNVDIRNRLVSFDICRLDGKLKKLGMLTIQDHVWQKVAENRNNGINTRFIVDEFHLLLKEKQTADFSVEIWKRFRKWGGIPTGLTQNSKDFLENPQLMNILDNSEFIYLLNQSEDDGKILKDKLHLSDEQLSYVTNADTGSGLLIYGGTAVPFKDQFPKDSLMYRDLTTKFSDLHRKKVKK